MSADVLLWHAVSEFTQRMDGYYAGLPDEDRAWNDIHPLVTPGSRKEFSTWCSRRLKTLQQVKGGIAEPVIAMKAGDDAWQYGQALGMPLQEAQRPRVFDPVACRDFLVKCMAWCNRSVDPVDDTAYQPAKCFLDKDHAKTPKVLWRILKENPQIRRRKPSPQRLEIHAGDWMAYLESLNKEVFSALGQSADVIDEALTQAQNRKQNDHSRRAK